MFSFLRRLRIGTKITLIVLSLVLLAVATVSFFAYNQSKSSIKERYLESMHIMADLKAKEINGFLNEVNAAFDLGKRQNEIANSLRKVETTQTPGIDSNIIADPFDTSAIVPDAFSELGIALEEAAITIQSVYKLNNIYIVDKDGIVRKISKPEISNQREGIKFIEPQADLHILNTAKDSTYFSKVVLQKEPSGLEKYLLMAASPIQDQENNNKFLGTLVYEIDMARIDSIVSNRLGLGKTGEVWLLQEQENKTIRYVNSTSKDKKKPLEKAGIKDDPQVSTVIKKAITGGHTNESFDEENFIAVTRYIAPLDWGMVIKVDKSEIYAPADELLQKFVIAGGITILATFLIGLLFSQFLVRPLVSLRRTVISIGKGELPPPLPVTSKDEIGEMTSQINELVYNLNNTASFALKIGEKDFDAGFKPAGEGDILGNALIAMRDSILYSAQADDQRNWIVTGVAEVGDILRASNDLKELGEKVLAYIVEKIGAIQGAFYVLNDEDKANQFFEMYSSYAYKKKKYLNAKFKFAEGLIGQAAIERDTILRTEIPHDYMTITSGLLGENKPKCLLITPLITNDTDVYGVLELAGFEKFGDREIKFVEDVSQIIARTIFNIKVNENTRKLLEEQTSLTQDLEEKQIILNENAREMEKTQEQLRKTNQELQYQIQQVQNEQRRTQVLLENASEVITIYEADGNIRYVSPSVRKILGYTPEEMIGTSDIEHIETGQDSFKKMFEDLLKYPDERITIQFSYKTKSGDSIWLETTGNNLLNDPVISGILLNTRDITERRRAEREERMRGQMQALSENSPDLIARLNREGVVYYINPIIEQYTGVNKENFLQRVLSTEHLPPQIVNNWLAVIETVNRRNQNYTKEMLFPSILGDRIMQVNAIPEKNEEGLLDSVLIVSHDITDRKLQQLEIETANKKIKDSINYAKRIQEAILPDNAWLQNYFLDSFILFKPRDVVSGDFPWMVRKGDYLYVAVVDCTGHGVPGALMSLIGYFLLNNILDTHENATPAQILELLDEQVTRTLRQGESDSMSKDGMDVSLCRIHLSSNEFEFSGAHRPLYFMDMQKTEGEDNLVEVKGDKFPIGGGQYKNRAQFTNTQIQYGKGDMLILFSDGLPDQFGGPDNRKFSPKRVRDIIKTNIVNPMAKMSDTFEDELKKWMKNNEVKQTDDILIIGIRF